MRNIDSIKSDKELRKAELQHVELMQEYINNQDKNGQSRQDKEILDEANKVASAIRIYTASQESK